ncbi:MAG: hypothetical protein ACREXT_12730, partial [Gammaproteobacteria bacterium]
KLLSAIGSTEPSTFYEFCSALKDDCPEKGDRDAWRELFGSLELAARHGFLDIERTEKSIESLQLTAAGANRVRASFDQKRGLFSVLE